MRASLPPLTASISSPVSPPPYSSRPYKRATNPLALPAPQLLLLLPSISPSMAPHHTGHDSSFVAPPPLLSPSPIKRCYTPAALHRSNPHPPAPPIRNQTKLPSSSFGRHHHSPSCRLLTTSPTSMTTSPELPGRPLPPPPLAPTIGEPECHPSLAPVTPPPSPHTALPTAPPLPRSFFPIR
jgi:hypothetical protein